MKSRSWKLGRFAALAIILTVIMAFVACSVPVTGTDTSTGTTTSTSTSSSTTIDGTIKPGITTVVGSVHGIVLDPAGKPVVGATFAYATENVVVDTSKELRSSVTDANGMFEIEGICSGDHTITFGGGAGYSQSIRSVHVPTLGELRDMIQLGTALDGNGNPIGDATLDLGGNPRVSVALDPLGTKVDGGATPNVVTLYPLSATVATTAYYSSSAQYQGAATALPSGTKIVFDFQLAGIMPNFFETTAGAGGSVNVSGLPAGDVEGYTILAFLPAGVAVAQMTNGLASGSNAGVFPASLYFTLSEAPWIYSVSPDISSDSTAVWLEQTFDPGTPSAPTPFVITFSRAMNKTSGILALSSNDMAEIPAIWEFDFTSSWNTAGTVLTVTPATRLNDGVEIELVLTGFLSADGVPLVSGTSNEKTLTFYTRPVFELASSNLVVPYPEGPTGRLDFPVSAVPTLTFNWPIVNLDALANYLVEGTLAGDPAVIGTLAASGSVLTFTPTAALKYDTNYTIFYDLGSGMLQGADTVSGSLSFKTAVNTNAISTAITLTSDLDYLEMGQGRTKYEFGDTTAYVNFTKVEPTNPNIAYYYQYRRAGAATWSAAAEITSYLTSSADALVYATMTIGELSPLAGTEIRVRAARTDGPILSAYSTTVTLADTTAPAAPVYGVLTGSDSPDNTLATTANAYLTVGFSLMSSEPMTIPTVGSISLLNSGFTASIDGSIYRVTKEVDSTIVYVTVKIFPTKNAATNIIQIPIADAAGNAFVGTGPGPVFALRTGPISGMSAFP